MLTTPTVAYLSFNSIYSFPKTRLVMGKQKTVSMDLHIWILAYWTTQNHVKGSKIHLKTKRTTSQYHLRTKKTKSIVQELFYSFVYLFLFFFFTKIHHNAWDLNLPSIIPVCAKKKEWITARCSSFHQMNRRSQVCTRDLQ